jgi:hypothetical protein
MLSLVVAIRGLPELIVVVTGGGSKGVGGGEEMYSLSSRMEATRRGTSAGDELELVELLLSVDETDTPVLRRSRILAVLVAAAGRRSRTSFDQEYNVDCKPRREYTSSILLLTVFRLNGADARLVDWERTKDAYRLKPHSV